MTFVRQFVIIFPLLMEFFFMDVHILISQAFHYNSECLLKRTNQRSWGQHLFFFSQNINCCFLTVMTVTD